METAIMWLYIYNSSIQLIIICLRGITWSITHYLLIKLQSCGVLLTDPEQFYVIDIIVIYYFKEFYWEIGKKNNPKNNPITKKKSNWLTHYSAFLCKLLLFGIMFWVDSTQ